MSLAEWVLSVVAPPPLGHHYPINEDLFQVLVCLTALAVLDRVVVRRLPASARYFALHAAANAVSAVCAAPDVWRALSSPLDALQGPSATMWANSAIVSIHAYHVMAFKLRSDELFHHALFVTILCGLAIPFKQHGGVANNLGCFILSGLPGGIDYVMLVLVKTGRMDPLTEKRVNARINTWLRGPAMVYYATLAYIAWLYGRTTLPTVALAVAAGLHFHNGQYYCAEAVQNYGFRLGQLAPAKKDQ